MDDPVRNPYIPEDEVQLSDGLPWGGSLRDQVRVGQLLTLTLVIFLIVASVVMTLTVLGRQEDAAPQGNAAWVWLIPGGLATAAACVCAAVVPRAISRDVEVTFRAGGEPAELPESPDATMTVDAARLIGGYNRATLIAQTLLAGAGIVNLVLMALDDQLLHLLPIAVCLIGVVVMVPTIGRQQALMKARFGDVNRDAAK